MVFWILSKILHFWLGIPLRASSTSHSTKSLSLFDVSTIVCGPGRSAILKPDFFSVWKIVLGIYHLRAAAVFTFMPFTTDLTAFILLFILNFFHSPICIDDCLQLTVWFELTMSVTTRIDARNACSVVYSSDAVQVRQAFLPQATPLSGCSVVYSSDAVPVRKACLSQATLLGGCSVVYSSDAVPVRKAFLLQATPLSSCSVVYSLDAVAVHKAFLPQATPLDGCSGLLCFFGLIRWQA